ncbi:unnamed protein product [Linum trigynum]|uniref:Uncharacterized protein n=1 Tax=Linum trigynum TaxID=586398 RepID=A0AAV2CHP7_9ROSI
MAPRLREQEGDLSPGFVMDLVANFELCQEGKGLVGNNGKVEALPPPAPSVKVTTTAMSRHLIVEETQKMMVENRLAMEENRQDMEENSISWRRVGMNLLDVHIRQVSNLLLLVPP